MRKIIGCDIDGVLADWNAAYYKVLVGLTGKDLVSKEDRANPAVWYWPRHYGYTVEEEMAGYAETAKDPTFWQMLDAYPDAEKFLEDIQQGDDIYFITTRPGVQSKAQTEIWFELWGYAHATVLLGQSPKAKGLLAAGLDLTHFIDDRAENCREVKLASPKTQVFLLDRNYNKFMQDDLRAMGVVVLSSLGQFLEALND
jgi:5'(3')-deoxyribonucleotidase